MKVKEFYVCSRCSRRGHKGSKCISCHVQLEKMCLVCNNAENNCYFIDCKRVTKQLKREKAKTKKHKKRKTAKKKMKKTAKKRGGKKRRK